MSNYMEHIIFSLWARGGSGISESPVWQVGQHYLVGDKGLRRVVSCGLEHALHPVLSINDIPPAERHERDRPAEDEWVIELDLLPVDKKESVKAGARSVRLGPGDIACPLYEHPVEVMLPFNAGAIKRSDHARGMTHAHAAKIIEEFKALCGEQFVSWALVTTRGRGPCLPELKAKGKPAYVDLSTVFLSADEFEESTLRTVAADTSWQRWERGWFGSVAPEFTRGSGGPVGFEGGVWRILSGWSYQQGWH